MVSLPVWTMLNAQHRSRHHIDSSGYPKTATLIRTATVRERLVRNTAGFPINRFLTGAAPFGF